jgi:hypothetical protein
MEGTALPLADGLWANWLADDVRRNSRSLCHHRPAEIIPRMSGDGALVVKPGR